MRRDVLHLVLHLELHVVLRVELPEALSHLVTLRVETLRLHASVVPRRRSPGAPPRGGRWRDGLSIGDSL